MPTPHAPIGTLPRQLVSSRERFLYAVMLMVSVGVYGGLVRRLRQITLHTVDKEPRWRARGRALLTGYKAPW